MGSISDWLNNLLMGNDEEKFVDITSLSHHEVTEESFKAGKSLLEEARKKNKQEQDALDGLKYVINGAKIWCDLCTVPDGNLKANYDTPSIQNKRVVTVVEKDSASLIFKGNCKKSPYQSSPCASVMKLGDWKNPETVNFQDELALVLKSTIKCEYGDVDIQITDCGQRNLIEELDITGLPLHDIESITFSGWWSPDYEGIRNLEQDSRGPKSFLGQTVYFQLTVSDDIPLGTAITFQLWDKDTLMFLDFLMPDDYKFGGKKVYKTAVVRKVQGKHRITIELFLDPNWNSDLVSDIKGYFKDGCLDFYWTWKYNNKDWTSNTNLLSVYPSETTLYIKSAISDTRYGLPEIYSNNGSIILYAINKLPDGTVKKFSMIKLRTITTFKFQADINQFKREIYKEAINLDTNKLESANYSVEEVTTFFKTNKDSSQIYIDEEIIEVPIEGQGKIAIKNFGIKAIKFAKEAAKIYVQFEILKEMKEMIPELSSNEKFNMPSLSTFVGFVPQLAVFSFGTEVIGWMVKGSLKEVDEVVEESFWADWQNAKARGLKDALNFIQGTWAIKNGLKFIEISNEVLNKLLKGEIKTFEKLEKIKLNEKQSEFSEKYTAFYTKIYDKQMDKNITIVDSIFINN